MMFIAIFAVVLISLSAHSGREFEAAEGYNAPLFSLTDTTGDSARVVSLADMKGQFVLVHFWDSCNPSSRINAIEYDRFAARCGSEQQFVLLSVNLDDNEALYREIIKSDKLNEETQFHVAGTDALRLIDAYNLQQGMNSFLLSPEGRVIAVNPVVQQLKSLIGG